MLNITETTTPTLDVVLEKLNAGEFRLASNNFGITDLAQQLFGLQPVVWRNKDAFEAVGYTEVERELIEGHRLLEIGGYMSAERRTITSEVGEQTQKQKDIRRRLIANRDACVRLARDVDVDSRLFSVSFGRVGDASRTLAPAHVLKALLAEHGVKLNSPGLVDAILAEVKADISELVKAEVAQETGKAEASLPTAARTAARQALYELLLHFSRVGFAVTRLDTEERKEFSLSVLRRASRSARPDSELDEADTSSEEEADGSDAAVVVPVSVVGVGVAAGGGAASGPANGAPAGG